MYIKGLHLSARVAALLSAALLLLLPLQALARDTQAINPILFSDYSDPDVIEVNGEYWMTSSSFNCAPGLQILHSYDLVHWQIVGAALPNGISSYRMLLDPKSTAPEHGCGVWAPSIRYHDGRFWIFWGDPDSGIYQVNTTNPCGRWSSPRCVLRGKGLIDPCPLWDEDGKVYLVHAWAGSRAGFKSVLGVCEMNSSCSAVIGPEVLVFNGKETSNPTVEGPKFYKRNGWYYIFAPAGGVKTGWQLVLRSRSPYGPYEWRNVMDEGKSGIHGPHQGGLVQDAVGDYWFLHFEDRYAWGRVVHLQPVKWTSDDWCVIGSDNGKGKGQPVKKLRKVPAAFIQDSADSTAVPGLSALATAPDFSGMRIPLNWQWQAAPRRSWYMFVPSENALRLNCLKPHESARNLWDAPNLLLEKIVGPEMNFQTDLRFCPSYAGDRAGIVVFGENYTTLELVFDGSALKLERRECANASAGSAEQTVFSAPMELQTIGQAKSCAITVKITISADAICHFEYTADGRTWLIAGDDYKATAGRWVGAKLGYFASASEQKNDGGYMTVR